MYVETRSPDNRMKSGRIARVELSKRGRTLYLDGKSFIALLGCRERDSGSGDESEQGKTRRGQERGAIAVGITRGRGRRRQHAGVERHPTAPPKR
jgi:hypothetical protein